MVPIPERLESLWATLWMRSLATSAIARRYASGDSPLRSAGSNESAAIREATSPACAPPIPSATANTGALA